MNKNERKIKNRSIGILFLLLGVSMSGLGGYFLYEKKEQDGLKEIARNNAIQQCKASGVRRGFMMNETPNTLVFYKNDAQPENYMSHLVGVNQIMTDCISLRLQSACIGVECDRMNSGASTVNTGSFARLPRISDNRINLNMTFIKE